MAISASDILIKLSTTTGTAGNQNSQIPPDTSLGKYISTTQLVTSSLNNLFSDETGDQNAASRVDYQCLFIHNNHASLTWISPVVWIDSEVSGGTSLAIGVDPTGATAIGSSSAQAVTIANMTTAPAGVSFSSPTSKATGLSLGNLAAGECIAIWIRRTAANSSALDSDGGVLGYAGDTNQ